MIDHSAHFLAERFVKTVSLKASPFRCRGGLVRSSCAGWKTRVWIPTIGCGFNLFYCLGIKRSSKKEDRKAKKIYSFHSGTRGYCPM